MDDSSQQMHYQPEPTQTVPDVATLMGELTAAMARMSAMGDQIRAQEAQFAQHLAHTSAREEQYRNQIESLNSALHSANNAGWINSAPASAPASAPVPPAATSSALPTPPSAAPSTPSRQSPRNPRTPSHGTPPSLPTPSPSPATSPKKPAKKKRAPPKTRVHRMTKAELQAPGMKGFVDAFKLHILILWNLLDVAAVPTLPSPDTVSWFNANFVSIDDVYAAREGSGRISESMIRTAAIGREARARSGTHAKQAGRVDKSALSWMAAYLSRFGFPSWAPDFTSTPYSLYNSACRIVAIFSFQQALLAQAYIHFGPVMSHINDLDLLIRLFDWYVWDCWWKRWDMERRNPGWRLRQHMIKLAYQWRRRLSMTRVETCKELGLDRYAIALADHKCHSDEEFDEKSGEYIVHAREGRSARMTALVQKLDEVRAKDAKRLGKSLPRTRKRVSMPKPSLLPMLPVKATLDWFDVEFYNSLSVTVRRAITNDGIALHEDDSCVTVQPAHPVEKLTMKAFMEQYGDITMSQYDIPESGAVDSDGDREEENTYWLKSAQTEMDVDSDDDEEMLGVIDNALSEQQELFRVNIAL